MREVLLVIVFILCLAAGGGFMVWTLKRKEKREREEISDCQISEPWYNWETEQENVQKSN